MSIILLSIFTVIVAAWGYRNIQVSGDILGSGLYTLQTGLAEGDAALDGVVHHHLVDEHGNIIDENGFMIVDGVRIDDEGNMVDEYGRLIDEDGNLIDESGRLIDEEGNLIEVDEGETPVEP